MTTRTVTRPSITLLDPVAEFQRGPDKLAERPQELSGRVLLLFDNLVTGHGGGEIAMNPLYAQLKEKLVEKYRFQDVVWVRKPDRGRPAPKDLVERVVASGEVVINGTCS